MLDVIIKNIFHYNLTGRRQKKNLKIVFFKNTSFMLKCDYIQKKRYVFKKQLLHINIFFCFKGVAHAFNIYYQIVNVSNIIIVLIKV